MTARAATFDKASAHRRAMLAKVHLAKKELRLQDDDYRAVLERVTGHASAGDCTEAELDRALAEFRRLGWQGASASRGAPRLAVDNRKDRARRPTSHGADHPAARKARALWISLHQLGVVRDPGEHALEAFAKRQLGVERLQWAEQGRVYRLIEALKAMAERAGWPQAGDPHELKWRLVDAQWKVLAGLRVVGDFGWNGMVGWIHKRMHPRVRQVGGPMYWTDEELAAISAALAGLIWEAKARKAAADGDGSQA
jgi:phage gp16-like protein